MTLTELFNLENNLNLDSRILALVSALLFISLVLFVLAIRRFLRRKLVSASIQSLSGLSFCFAGLFSLSFAVNLYSYERLTYEQPIANMTFKQLGEQRFRVEISYHGEKKKGSYIISGDEWQIDARIIKWHGWAQLLGLNAQYRLERIGGRYSDIEEERAKRRSAYALDSRDDIDYWKIINRYKKWLPWVDAYYGSATYLPMLDNASYSLSLTQTGLIARPLDTETEERLKF